MKRIVVAILILCLLVSVIAGCAPAQDPAPEVNQTQSQSEDENEDGKFVVGVAAKSFSDPWTYWMAQLIEKEVAENYPEFELRVLDCEFQADKQINVLENLITQKVDLIILQPVDRTTVGETVAKAWDAGIPVISNQQLENDERSYFVRAEPETEGRMEGTFMAELLPQDAKIVIIEGAPGNISAIGRHEGIHEILDNERPDIEILGSKTANWQRAEAMALMEDWIQAFPQIDAVISHNDDCLIGAIEALKAADRLEGVATIGVDGLSEACYYIKNGEQTASVLNNAPDIARKILELAHTILVEGEFPEQKEYFIEGVLITQDNVDEIIQMHKDSGFWTYD